MNRIVKCILVDTAYPVNIRNEKIMDSLRGFIPDIDIRVITWDRNKIAQSSREGIYYLYRGDVKLGDRIKKFLYLHRFKRFVEDIISKEKPNIIIASHWETLYALPRRVNQSACVIYENLDIPDGSRIAIKVGTFIERKSLYKADIITHASRFFLKLFEGCKQKQIVLENKPMFDGIEQKSDIGNPFVISFIGTIRYFETISKLVDALKDDSRFELHFYGGGPDYELLSHYCSGICKVKLFGKYDYKDVKFLYRASDLIWAVYPNKDYNVKYAISNKFYESMYLGVPCVYANKTELGDFVDENRIGYTVDPYSVEKIKELLEQVYLEKTHYNEIKHNIYEFAKQETTWDADFNGLMDMIKHTGKITCKSL